MKQKTIAFLLAVFLLLSLFLSACGTKVREVTPNENDPGRFQRIYEQENDSCRYYIFQDMDTSVLWLFYYDGNNSGGLAPLMNRDGSIMTAGGWE